MEPMIAMMIVLAVLTVTLAVLPGVIALRHPE